MNTSESCLWLRQPELPATAGTNPLWPGTRVMWTGSAPGSKPEPATVQSHQQFPGHVVYYLLSEYSAFTISAGREQLDPLPPFANA